MQVRNKSQNIPQISTAKTILVYFKKIRLNLCTSCSVRNAKFEHFLCFSLLRFGCVNWRPALQLNRTPPKCKNDLFATAIQIMQKSNAGASDVARANFQLQRSPTSSGAESREIDNNLTVVSPAAVRPSVCPSVCDQKTPSRSTDDQIIHSVNHSTPHYTTTIKTWHFTFVHMFANNY